MRKLNKSKIKTIWLKNSHFWEGKRKFPYNWKCILFLHFKNAFQMHFKMHFKMHLTHFKNAFKKCISKCILRKMHFKMHFLNASELHF
jgi:hypothetical protein